jgi:hypothetical protein
MTSETRFLVISIQKHSFYGFQVAIPRQTDHPAEINSCWWCELRDSRRRNCPSLQSGSDANGNHNWVSHISQSNRQVHSSFQLNGDNVSSWITGKTSKARRWSQTFQMNRDLLSVQTISGLGKEWTVWCYHFCSENAISNLADSKGESESVMSRHFWQSRGLWIQMATWNLNRSGMMAEKPLEMWSKTDWSESLPKIGRASKWPWFGRFPQIFLIYEILASPTPGSAGSWRRFRSPEQKETLMTSRIRWLRKLIPKCRQEWAAFMRVVQAAQQFYQKHSASNNRCAVTG